MQATVLVSGTPMFACPDGAIRILGTYESVELAKAACDKLATRIKSELQGGRVGTMA